MSSTAVWEACLFLTIAAALGLSHLWNDKRVRRQKAAAQDALLLDEIRQQAVKQLKIEQHAWSVKVRQEDAPANSGRQIVTDAIDRSGTLGGDLRGH